MILLILTTCALVDQVIPLNIESFLIELNHLIEIWRGPIYKRGMNLGVQGMGLTLTKMKMDKRMNDKDGKDWTQNL